MSLINERDLQENPLEKKGVLQENIPEKKDVPVSEKLVLNYGELSLMKDEEKREDENLQIADLQKVGEGLQVEDEDVAIEVPENDNQTDIQEGVGIVAKNIAIEEDHEIDCLPGEFIADRDYSKLMD